MEWREEFSVGDEQFDNDHKLIFDMVGRLKSASSDEINAEFLEVIFDDPKSIKKIRKKIPRDVKPTFDRVIDRCQRIVAKKTETCTA